MSLRDNDIVLQLKLTKNIMENEHNKYLKPFNISNEQGLFLKYIYETPGATQTQIAEFLHKDKATITRMVDTLIKKGKIFRKSSSNDRRVYKIYLTEVTKKNAQELSPIFKKQDNDLRCIISENDYEVTLKVLEKIKNYYRGLNK